MNSKVLIGGAAILILLLISGYFLFNQQKTTQTPSTSNETQNEITNQVAPTSQSTSSATQSGNTVNLTVEGSNFKFVPNNLTVKTGDKVKITFKNTSGIHNFNIDDLDVNTPVVQSGQDATVEFTASKSGSFEFYCSVGNHRAQGMKGTLVVQ